MCAGIGQCVQHVADDAAVTCMLNQSKNVVVSGGSLTVHSTSYECQHEGYPTNSRAGISEALKMLHGSSAMGAMHNSKDRYDAPKCHPDTRKAVLGDITSWVSDHSKRTSILWLSAPAGSGKSAILQQIAENFHNSGGLLASFFFSRTVAKRDTETCLTATLASQLAMSIPATRPFIEGAIERDPFIFGRVLSEQVTRLVVHPLVHASLHPENHSPWPTLLVIDGLDECNGGDSQVDILRILRTALLQLKFSLPILYLLIASRPEPAITAVFDDELSEITQRLVLDDTYHPDRDITVYLKSSFADIYRRRHARFPSMASLPQPWPSERVISFLVKKSSGQFIFAATVIRFIDVDRKVPPAQLQLILDICKSVDSSRYEANPFALLDELYTHVLNSSQETEQAISILGAIFYLDSSESPTLHFLQVLLRLEPDDVTMIFWDLHSIVYIPVSNKDPIRFYHASLRDFLLDRHRSGNLYVDGSEAHLFLFRSCIRTKSDKFCGGSIQERLALQYSRNYCIKHYLRGDDLNPGFLDKVLEEFKPETWLPLDISAGVNTFSFWWKEFAPLRGRFHGRCEPGKCSALCFRYTSILDQYLVHRFRTHKIPAVLAALMWLTVLGSGGKRPNASLGPYALIVREVEWLWDIPTSIENRFQFCCFLMQFLSDHGRSHHLFVGGAISTTHFAHVCAQRSWRSISALDRPFGSENWRTLFYLYDILRLLPPWGSCYEGNYNLTEEMAIQDIQKRIADLADLVQFVEATGLQKGSFEDHALRWRDIRTRDTLSGINFTTVNSAPSGRQSAQDEVGTLRSQGKRQGLPAPLSNSGTKHRKIVINGPLNLADKTATNDVREGETSVNDGRDIEHAIEIDSD